LCPLLPPFEKGGEFEPQWAWKLTIHFAIEPKEHMPYKILGDEGQIATEDFA